MLLEKAGKSDQAVSVMKNILAKNADHAGALNFIGYMWAEQKVRLVEAEKYVRKALKLKPDDPFIMDSRWVLYQRGHLEEARTILSTALTDSTR